MDGAARSHDAHPRPSRREASIYRGQIAASSGVPLPRWRHWPAGVLYISFAAEPGDDRTRRDLREQRRGLVAGAGEILLAAQRVHVGDRLLQRGRSRADHADIAVGLLADPAGGALGLPVAPARTRACPAPSARPPPSLPSHRYASSCPSKNIGIVLDQRLRFPVEAIDHFLRDLDVQVDLDRLVGRADVHATASGRCAPARPDHDRPSSSCHTVGRFLRFVNPGTSWLILACGRLNGFGGVAASCSRISVGRFCSIRTLGS